MPDRVTRGSLGPRLRQPLLLVLVLVLAGGACGALWELIWEPSIGTVVEGRFYLDGPGLRHDFSATASYVLIAVVAGLLLGVVLAALADRDELSSLGALLGGSLLATWTMMMVGAALGPADPDELAKHEPDRARLPSALVAHGSAWTAFPVGTLTGAAIVLLGTRGRSRRPSMAEDPRHPTEDRAVHGPGTS